MAEPNYANFIDRILETLGADGSFVDAISEFRFGDLPKEEWGNDFPLCYVTTAKNPEVFRIPFTPQGNVNLLPGEKRELEFWVILLVSTNSLAEETQTSIYDLTNMALGILQQNIQMRDVNGNNPLCATSKIFTQGRLERNRGKLLEAMTIRLRPTIFVNGSFID